MMYAQAEIIVPMLQLCTPCRNLSHLNCVVPGVVWITGIPSNLGLETPSLGQPTSTAMLFKKHMVGLLLYAPSFHLQISHFLSPSASPGFPPNFVPALASATVVSLIYAISDAFTQCTFVDPANLNADSLLFNASAIDCANFTGTGSASGEQSFHLKDLSLFLLS